MQVKQQRRVEIWSVCLGVYLMLCVCHRESLLEG